MKYLILIFFVAVLSCSAKDESAVEIEKDYKVIVIDSCEYIEKYNGYQLGMNFSHKGNCKFCKERK